MSALTNPQGGIMNLLVVDVGRSNVNILATGQDEARKFSFGPKKSAFGCSVKLINDAAMQALGSYRGGKLLFLGLGTGLGSAMVVDGIVMPMEQAHLPCKKGTYVDYLGADGLKKREKKKWRKHFADVVAHLISALLPDDVVLGGGKLNKVKELPPDCRAGDNANAFLGGFRLWEDSPWRRKGGRGREPAESRNQIR
jgi:polyphosphate glucokinase